MYKHISAIIIATALALSGCASSTTYTEFERNNIWIDFTAMRGDRPFCVWDLTVAVDSKSVNPVFLPTGKMCTSSVPWAQKNFPQLFWRKGVSSLESYWGYKSVTFTFKRSAEGPKITCNIPIAANLQVQPDERLRGLDFILTEDAVVVEQWTTRPLEGHHRLHVSHRRATVVEIRDCRPSVE